MALLTETWRARVWRALIRRFSDRVEEENDPLPINKTQLREVVDAIDQWCESNTVSFNTAIPQPQRGLLTTNQKAKLLMYVTWARSNAPMSGGN